MTASIWGPVLANTVKADTFSKGRDDLLDFLPNVLHESAMLEKMEENLSYSAGRICEVWPSRFPDVASALPFARNPRALANKVYGGREGNTEPNDGWDYRGRGPLGLTFKNNYQVVGDLMGQDLVGNPDLAAQPHFALEACIAWWEHNIPDSVLGQQSKVRRKVNNSERGLDEIVHLRRKLEEVL